MSRDSLARGTSILEILMNSSVPSDYIGGILEHHQLGEEVSRARTRQWAARMASMTRKKRNKTS